MRANICKSRLSVTNPNTSTAKATPMATSAKIESGPSRPAIVVLNRVEGITDSVAIVMFITS